MEWRLYSTQRPKMHLSILNVSLEIIFKCWQSNLGDLVCSIVSVHEISYFPAVTTGGSMTNPSPPPHPPPVDAAKVMFTLC